MDTPLKKWARGCKSLSEVDGLYADPPPAARQLYYHKLCGYWDDSIPGGVQKLLLFYFNRLKTQQYCYGWQQFLNTTDEVYAISFRSYSS